MDMPVEQEGLRPLPLQVRIVGQVLEGLAAPVEGEFQGVALAEREGSSSLPDLGLLGVLLNALVQQGEGWDNLALLCLEGSELHPRRLVERVVLKGLFVSLPCLGLASELSQCMSQAVGRGCASDVVMDGSEGWLVAQAQALLEVGDTRFPVLERRMSQPHDEVLRGRASLGGNGSVVEKIDDLLVELEGQQMRSVLGEQHFPQLRGRLGVG